MILFGPGGSGAVKMARLAVDSPNVLPHVVAERAHRIIGACSVG